MGMGNGAFQAARISIDGVTIIENIVNGKIQTTAQAAADPSFIISSPSIGTAWGIGTYIVETSPQTNFIEVLRWNTPNIAQTIIDALALLSGSSVVDGTGSSHTNSGTSVNFNITTTNTNDIIVVFVTFVPVNGLAHTISVSDTSGLTWIPRASAVNSFPLASVYEFYAVAASTVNGDTITVTSNITGAIAAQAAGFTNVNTAAPFDTNASAPTVYSTGASANSATTGLLNTTGSNTNIIAYWGGGGGSSGFVLVSSGVTAVNAGDGSLTISPNTGPVVAILNTGNANTWTGTLTMTSGASAGGIILNNTSISSTGLVLNQNSVNNGIGLLTVQQQGTNLWRLSANSTGPLAAWNAFSTYPMAWKASGGTTVFNINPNGTITTTDNTLDNGSGIATFTGIDDETPFVDGADTTKQVLFSLAGLTTGVTLTVSSSQSTSQTLTIPNITGSDTLATLGLSQTFTGTLTLGGSAPQMIVGVGSSVLGEIKFFTTGDSNGTLLRASSTSGLITISMPATGTTLAGLAVTQTFSAANTFSAITTTAGTAAGATALSAGSPYSVLTTDEVLLITTGSSADYTITLPAANANAGRKLIIIKVDSGTNKVIVSRAGADTIEGATTKNITAQYGKVGLVSDGTSVWYDLGTGGV